MLCEVCHKKKATVHYTEIVKNQMVKMNLCEICAKEKGIDIYSKFSVADLLAGLTDLESARTQFEDQECSACGMNYPKFKAIGRFGCPKCYQAFDDMLKPLLESIHRANSHVGKEPKRWLKRSTTDVEMKELEAQLQKAVAQEAFEEAARIRDQLNKLKDSKRRRK